MDSEAAFKNIWIPRRKLELNGVPQANGVSDVPAAEAAEEELEQFRQIVGQDYSADSEDDFAAAMKSISGEGRAPPAQSFRYDGEFRYQQTWRVLAIEVMLTPSCYGIS